MEDKTFIFTDELNKRLLELRFENDWLFKKKKQPWKEFHKILLENGFPEELTVDQTRKRWSYMYDSYKIAKKDNNKSYKFFKLFDKFYGKTKYPDKYESWNDEWRLKLITCITETKAMDLDEQNMWLTVERAMRCQDLPHDCCIQDIKGLWHHIKMTYTRKERMTIRHKRDYGWALLAAMREYWRRFEPPLAPRAPRAAPSRHNKYNRGDTDDCDEYEFTWNKHLTESFIQIRLQHDWLFRKKKWAWNELKDIMVEQFGFPKDLPARDICKKWASTYGDYQKAKATNNKSWQYYNIFELYLGEGNLSLNPLVGWEEEWVLNLISARIDLHHTFRYDHRERNEGWREVEKRLRSIGLPLDHSLLDLPEIWAHLIRTYRWKKKFANKGVLKEQWPYMEAMTQFDSIPLKINENLVEKKPKRVKRESIDDSHFNNNEDDDDDYEDDIKLFDLKQRLEMQMKPKYEYLATQCRSCSCEEGCVNIFDQVDDEGFSLADKLRAIGDIQIEANDNLPTHICLKCINELESAFKFRRKCQKVDQEYRNTTSNVPQQSVKIEFDADEQNDHDDNDMHVDDTLDNDIQKDEEPIQVNVKPVTRVTVNKIKKAMQRRIPRKKKRVRKEKYVYYKVCDICGKNTTNLPAHLDAHSTEKAYSCDVCDKKFRFKSGLLIHKAVHEATPRKTCEICGKAFHILAQYRRHFVYHANERKFGCETCGKRFNTIDILKVHSRIHNDERPFPCPECGKTFRTAGCVSRHKRIVHKSIKNQ